MVEFLDTIDVTNQSVAPTKELGHGGAIIDHWGITHDSVGSDGLIAAGNVEDGVMSHEAFLVVIIGGNCSSIMRGDLICCLNDFFRLEAKIWVE